MQERYLTIGEQPFCLCEWGQRGNPGILLVHGLLQQGASWDPIARDLAGQGYFVVAPDLRGHGRSARVGRGSIHATLDFLLDIDHALGAMETAPVLLVGHSLGAIMAALTTRVRAGRVAGLILIEPIVPPNSAGRDTIEELRATLDGYLALPPHPVYPSLNAAASWLREFNPGVSEAMACMLAERTTEPCEQGVRWTWDPSLRNPRGVFFGSSPQAYVRVLQGIRVPVTIIYGKASAEHNRADRELQKQALPQCREIMLEGSHNLYFEAAAQVSAYIEELARATLPRASSARGRE